jgi:hypothetical protein
MIFTNWELAGLNQISGGGPLPGVMFPSGVRPDAGAVTQGLRYKGVVGPDGHLSAFGMVPVRAVEQYRTASRHVFLNQMKVSRNDDGSCTVLHPAEHGWGLSRMAPVGVLLALLEAYPFLRLGTPAGAVQGVWAPMGVDEFAAAMVRDGAASATSSLVVRTSGRVASGPVAYAAPGGAGLAFDMARMVGCAMPVSVIKKRLADALGCVGSRVVDHV